MVKKLDPKAKLRNRPEPIFSDKSPLVTDSKDHFPIDTLGRARNALAQAAKFDGKAPEWFKGSYSKFIKMVKSAVKKEYPSIDVELKESFIPNLEVISESVNYYL